MYSKRNRIISLALVLIISLASLAGCKKTVDNPESNTDVSTMVVENAVVDFEKLCLWDYNDLSDYLESKSRSGNLSFDPENGEYIKLFEDGSLAKEITDYKTVLDHKMVVQKFDANGLVLSTYKLSENEGTSSDTSVENTSSTVESDNQKITVVVWGSKDDRTLKEAIDEYNKYSPVYQVKLEIIPEGDTLARLKQAKAKVKAPDVVCLDSSDLILGAQDGLICDLSSHGVYQHQGNFVTSAYNAMTKAGSVYGLPFDAETTCLAYNMDIYNFVRIKEAPETYDELVEQLKEIFSTYSDKNAPLGLFETKDKMSVADTFISWLYRCGGSLLSSDGKTAEFDSAMGERALQLISDLYKNNYASANWTIGEFYSGKTALYEVSSNRYNGTFGSGAKANFEAVEHPDITYGDNPSTFKVNGYGVVDNGDIVRMQGAYDFIVFYCADKQYQVNYAVRNSRIPTLEKAQDDSVFDEDNMEVFIDILEDAKSIPAFDGSDIVKEYIADAVLSVINDNVPITDALSKAAKKTEARLKRN